MSDAAPIPEPSRRLGSSARAYWTVGALAGAIPGAIAAVVAGGALRGRRRPSAARPGRSARS